MTPERLQIMGCPVDVAPLEQGLALALGAPAGARPHIVLAVNPEKIMAASQDPRVRASLWRATFLLPDGVGVVLALRLLARRRIARLTGIDFMGALLKSAAKTNRSVFLHGAAPGVAERAGTIACRLNPGLRLIGTHRGFDPDQEAVLRHIEEAAPDLLFVALGSPRQERWIADHAERLSVDLVMGVGGSFDVLAGDLNRAPLWLRRAGLEWLYRLLESPARWRRMPVLARFTARVIRLSLSGAGSKRPGA